MPRTFTGSALRSALRRRSTSSSCDERSCPPRCAEPGDGTRSRTRTLQAVVGNGLQGRRGRLPRKGCAGLVEELEEVGRHDRTRFRYGRFELREAGHENLLGPLVASLPEVREGLLDEGQGQRRLRETEEEVDLGLGRSLGGPGDLSKDVEEVPEKVPVGLARRKRRGNGERLQRRVARGGAVHLEKRERSLRPSRFLSSRSESRSPPGRSAERSRGWSSGRSGSRASRRRCASGPHRGSRASGRALLGDRFLDPLPPDHLLGEAEQGHRPAEVSLVELLDPRLDHLAESLRPLLGVGREGDEAPHRPDDAPARPRADRLVGVGVHRHAPAREAPPRASGRGASPLGRRRRSGKDGRGSPRARGSSGTRWRPSRGAGRSRRPTASSTPPSEATSRAVPRGGRSARGRGPRRRWWPGACGHRRGRVEGAVPVPVAARLRGRPRGVRARPAAARFRPGVDRLHRRRERGGGAPEAGDVVAQEAAVLLGAEGLEKGRMPPRSRRALSMGTSRSSARRWIFFSAWKR